VLNNFTPANNDEKIWAVTEKIKLDRLKGKIVAKSDLQQLQQMFTKDDNWINVLMGILVANNLAPDLYFRQPKIVSRVLPQPNEMVSSSLKIYPNPAKDQLNIQFEQAEGSMQEIVVTDIVGVTVLKYKLEFDKGTVTLDISRLSPGTYLISIPNFLGNKQISKFTKIN
jgi:hypothetical protein